ncbi:MAG: alpha-amylase/4-alpha-glucanotransferase domain-containing protein [Candidatus Thermochlorobacter sp.]
MKKINLIFGTHNHQPIGNFDSIFEDAYQRAYKPFLDVFEKFPNLKISKHYTGILFEWLLAKHPDFFDQLRALVKRGNIELISGGFYEPILAVIPDEDKIGQIEKLTKFIKKHFGFHAVGLWLAERIWEQHLTKPLAQAGIRYVILDDTHFKYAGLSEEQLLGYYITEEQGYTTHLFPISKTLRYTIPFQPVEKTLEYLHSVADESGQRLVVFADDGEKFGVWPNTYEHVYTKDRWLEQFFKALDENRSWIRMMTFAEALRELKPIGRIYLSNASYAEMMHWSLPTVKSYLAFEQFEKTLKAKHLLDGNDVFVRGGFWRNFMVKYPEANQMHKRMLEVSARAQALLAKGKKVSGKVFDKVWAAQCNCPYWHGVFGGTYLPNLRHPIYQNLIDAEVALDEIENKQGDVSVSVYDFDRDGQEDVVLKSNELSLYFKPSDGGKLIELDYKAARKNILDIFTRREEGYHQQLRQAAKKGAHAHAARETVASIHDIVKLKEANLDEYLYYDSYRRGSLIDHFFEPSVTAKDLYQSKAIELGDFITKPYSVKLGGNKAKRAVLLECVGEVRTGAKTAFVQISKTILLAKGKSEFAVDYALRLVSGDKLSVRFGVEFAYGLLAGDAPDRYYYFDGMTLEDRRLRSIGEVRSPMVGLKDEWLHIHARLEASEEATVLRYPIETISLSEDGFERVYQGSVVVMCFDLTLTKKPYTLSFVQRFSRA